MADSRAMSGRRSWHSVRPSPELLPLLVLAALLGAPRAQEAAAPATKTAPQAGTDAHARIEDFHGLRIVHTWGTPQQRGHAHGLLLANDIAAAMRLEFAARFERRQALLEQARKALPRLIEYPADVRAEIEALYQGIVDSGVSRALGGIDRDFDLDDVLIANALDVFGLMGCSGFTVWGDQVEGGGVLTGRNFDWPFTGPHLLDQTIVLVQHGDDGTAVASVTWPGYVGTVTGIDEEGVAAFLHVGSARITLAPEPGSWPTAVAAREILQQAHGDDPAQVFATAQTLLSNTSPPAGFLTRIVLPQAPASGSPAGLFETDSRKCVRAVVDGPCVVTNHFLTRTDGREASGDSIEREKQVHACIDRCLHEGDHHISVAEGWEMLGAVQRGGGKRFGTLHSLVFRQQPWCFELRLASLQDGKLVAAPQSERRFQLPRELLFPANPAQAEPAHR